MIRAIWKDDNLKKQLNEKIYYMVGIGVDDRIVETTTDLEFYAYYHEKFLKGMKGDWEKEKMLYQKRLYEGKFEMIKRLVDVRGKYMLDVGQEDCYYSELFGRGGGKMEAINVQFYLGYGGDKSCVKIYDGINVPFGDGVFDVVLIHMVLHHVVRGWRELLENIYRVMKKGGVLIVEEHDFNNELMNEFIDVYHFLYELIGSVEFGVEYYNSYEVRRFRKEELVGALQDIGFGEWKFVMGKRLNKYHLVIRK